jgi:hypothetical protein
MFCVVFFLRSSFSIFLFLFFCSWFCLSSDLRLWLHLWYVQAFRQANKHILKPDLNHGLLSSSFREYTKNHHSLLSFCSTQSPFRVVFKKYFYIVHFKRIMTSEETGIPGENHQHWQTLSHNVISSISRLSGIRIHNDSVTRIIQSLYYAPAGRYINSSSDIADRGRSIIRVKR